MKYILTIYLAALILSGQAQNKTHLNNTISQRPKYDSNIKSLIVGDKIPDLVISKIINDTKRVAKVSDFKNQLLILDFWETSCGSCIEALPKLDSLQKQFGNKIKILGVTWQSEAVVKHFFETNRFLKGLKPACVVEDKLLGSHFKHKIISHLVWIFKGKVISTTSSEYVTKENIETILNGKNPTWPVKRDELTFDPDKPIFSLREADQYNQKNSFLSYSGITGQREGVDYKGYKGGIGYHADSLNHIYRTYFYNRSVVQLYHLLWFTLVPKNFIPIPGRLVLEVKDPSKYVYDPNTGYYDQWKREHEVCYEMVISKTLPENERLKNIVNDLNLKLGLNGRWEKRKTKCLVISKIKDVKNIDSINLSRRGRKITINGIIVFSLDQTGKYPPAIDESNFKDQMIIEPFNTIDDLRYQLQLYGCDIVDAEREIDVMVITENDYRK